jgi:hypothetical protein
MDEPTHIFFDGEKVFISKNLHNVFDFLVKIEKEIQGMLNMREQLETARNTISGFAKLSKLLLEKYPNNQDLKIENFFDEDPNLSIDKLDYVQISRSEMIVLFANLETMMSLKFIYDLPSVDDAVIRRALMDKKRVKKFIGNYIFNEKNPFYRDNINRFKTTSNSNLRDLRNSLTHFFSVKGFAISDKSMDIKARQLEKKFPNKVTFISPHEFNELLSGVFKLLLIEWDNDSRNHPEDFKMRIGCVSRVIEAEGPKLIYDYQLDGDTLT